MTSPATPQGEHPAAARAEPTGQPIARKKRSGFQLLVKVIGFFVVLGVVGLCAAPYVLSGAWLRQSLAEALSDSLNSRVAIEDHDFSWFSGVELVGLEVDNPPGYPEEHPAFRLEKMSGVVSVFDLFWFRFSVSGMVEGLELRVHERADGSTNLGNLFGRMGSRGVGRGGGVGDGSVGFDPSRLQLDLVVQDSLVEIIHEERGILESLSGIESEILKTYNSSKVRLGFEADLRRPGGDPGRVEFKADVDLDTDNPSLVSLETSGLDLSRYGPLLNSFLSPADYPTAFAGVLEGKMEARVQASRSVVMDGDLHLRGPRFAGGVFGDLVLDGEEWSVRPKLSAGIDEDLREVSAAGFEIDLGFLQVHGMNPDDAASLAGRPALGFEFDLDLDRFAQMGMVGLERMRAGAGRAEGRLALATETDTGGAVTPREIETLWPGLLRVEAQVDLDGYVVEGFDVRDMRLDLDVRGAEARVETQPGALLNGGAITILAKGPLIGEGPEGFLSNIAVEWQGGRVRGDAVRFLRYCVPMLAGLPVDQVGELDFDSGIETTMSLTGNVVPRSGQSTLEWLNGWRGAGQLSLLDGSFTPAPAWQTVFEFASLESPVDFQRIDSTFEFSEGAVRTELAEFNRLTSSWSIRGAVTMDGAIDYQIDLRDLLRGHSDGEKVLAVLGEQPLEVRMTGNLDEPELPDLSYQDVLGKAVGGAAKGLLQDLLKGEKSTILDLLKKKKKK